MARALMITGATGKQGGAVINSLLAQPSDFVILAVTRNVKSNSAIALLAKSKNIKLVQGDMNDVPKMFSNAVAVAGLVPIWGVFSVQAFGGGTTVEMEEAQGKAMVDEALKRNVQFFVFTSVDRGGDEKSWTNPTDVPHFASKHRIEHHLRQVAKGTIMAWTVLRPVAFMENFDKAIPAKVLLANIRTILGEKRLQYISVQDIGVAAAAAFADPGSWAGRGIGLAADEASYQELNLIWHRATGSPAPASLRLDSTVFEDHDKELGLMMNWFGREGYGVDLEGNRKFNPTPVSLETWLRSSPWNEASAK